MKLKTRLIISFCTVIFMPIFLMSIALWGLYVLQTKI